MREIPYDDLPYDVQRRLDQLEREQAENLRQLREFPRKVLKEKTKKKRNKK